MITHMPGFQFFKGFLHHIELAKLATSNMKVNALLNIKGNIIDLNSSMETRMI